MSTNAELVDDLARWFEREYSDAIATLAQRYPDEQSHLTVSWSDLLRFNPDVADDYLDNPRSMDKTLRQALGEVNVPNVTFNDVEIRVVDLNDEDVYQPIDVLREDPSGYIGVRGELAKVSEPTKEIQEAAFECVRCGTPTYIPQSGDDLQEPHECAGCERQGPFEPLPSQSTFKHHSKVRIETPPDETGALQTDTMDGDVRGDLVWSGHEEVGVAGRTGDAVTAYGTVEFSQVGDNDRHFEAELDIDAIAFDEDADDTDIEGHRDTFERLAGREDAVDVFARSLVPELHATAEWEHGLELLVAYLFGAPRIDVPEGPTYRGDIHALFISDYGMGKSMVNNAVAMFSPKCIKESVTGMSSDVGLLAAAVEDDFAGSSWTLRPGILVRANGGHVILDEIDKTDANLERMNDALEGEQVVDVNKAGQSATFKSRVGLLATGNPENSRFDSTVPNSQQLNIDKSLLSRFDGIVLMEDETDPEQDAAIAETQLESYLEGQEVQYGDRDELDTLSREVPPDVGRAWIAEARENVHPILSRDHFERITEWYADEVRQLNNDFANDDGDMPVPANARSVMATVRFSVAFARVHLRDKVADADVTRAMELSKALIGQNFDGDKFVAAESQRTPTTQDERVQAVRDLINEFDDGDGADADELLSAAQNRYDMTPANTEGEIQKLKDKGEVYEPQNDRFKTT
jgi:replicative DNA helicase Mcm